MKLKPSEQAAINQFLAENWELFVESVKEYLTEEECDALGQRLAKQG